MRTTLHASLLLAALVGLPAGCSSDPAPEDHAIVTDATRLPDAAPTNLLARTEIDRAAQDKFEKAEFETATFALG